MGCIEYLTLYSMYEEAWYLVLCSIIYIAQGIAHCVSWYITVSILLYDISLSILWCLLFNLLGLLCILLCIYSFLFWYIQLLYLKILLQLFYFRYCACCIVHFVLLDLYYLYCMLWYVWHYKFTEGCEPVGNKVQAWVSRKASNFQANFL